MACGEGYGTAELARRAARVTGVDANPEAFEHACEVLITAQEIIIDRASYPTEKIAENSRDYRPLGIGSANLGAPEFHEALDFAIGDEYTLQACR